VGPSSGGRRSGAAIGFQQTVLSAIGIAAPVAFAALGQAFDFAYYAYDTREFGLDTAGAAASRIVTELREGVV